MTEKEVNIKLSADLNALS